MSVEQKQTLDIAESIVIIGMGVNRAIELLKAARCPDMTCKDGSIPHQIGDNEWEAQQCQWCFEREELLR